MTQMFEDDPFGAVKPDAAPTGPTSRDVKKFHINADTDSSVFSIHHTLGIKHNQASPGDHNHEGLGSKKIGDGLSLSVTGSKGGNVALANLLTMLAQVIDFTDTTTT